MDHMVGNWRVLICFIKARPINKQVLITEFLTQYIIDKVNAKAKCSTD